uniref:Ctenidin-3-like n=1 Tax=Dermatophagoides pteronyssinus TaxID=6956 RepID=A0A6P6Y2P1_DERPT|nr:ctenidin-3-like [Dermatophagoides pteronyssinus]
MATKLLTISFVLTIIIIVILVNNNHHVDGTILSRLLMRRAMRRMGGGGSFGGYGGYPYPMIMPMGGPMLGNPFGGIGAMADARLRLRKGGYGGIHNGRIYGGGFGRRDGGYGSIGPGGIYGGGFGRR